MKYISICSGIEAASVAWHGLGWQPIAFSEIEAFPSAVLAHHWPDVPNLGDMTKFAEWPEEVLAECDILVGGPPCQAFSVAGLRKSLDDARGNITLAYVRLLTHIDEVRKRHGRPPAIAVYENVPGLLSTKDNAFGCLVGALAGCDEAVETESGKWPKAGYVCGETRRVGYRVIDAQYFGVAQRRRRIFLVAVPCELVERIGERVCPSEILSLRESMLGNPPTRSQSWEGASRSTAASLTSSGRGVERPGESRGQDDLVIAAVYPTIDASIDRKWGSNQWVNNGFAVLENPAVAFKPGQSEAAGGTFATDEYAPTLQSQNNGSTAVPAVAFTAKDYGGDANDEVSPTMRAMGHSESHDNGGGQLAVAFKPGYFTRGKAGKPDTVAPAVLADADKGDQDTVVCATGPITHSLTTRSACEEDGTGRGNPIVPSIGFNWQNGGGYGNANDGLGITEEGTGPLQRCNTPAVAFKESQSGCRASDVHATIDANKGSRRQEGVFGAMQVRRLTPTECEYLQGFPAGHTSVIYRKKPAADGPRYRALGNSMAVPCMLWVGYRIALATEGHYA